MHSFKLPTEIKIFDFVYEVLDSLKISENDLLLTNRQIIEPALSRFNVKCRIVYQEDYGAGEPNVGMVNAIKKDLGFYDFERVLAMGGGTIIDIGKLLALSNTADISDILNGTVLPEKKRKMIAVPTNCCNGSEVSNIAIIKDSGDSKRAVVSSALYPDEAVLAPELLTGLPYDLFALSSLDALVTAIESFLAPSANPITDLFAINAIQKILGGYKNIAEKGPKAYREIIGPVLVGSNFAGIAFCSTGVGAVHAMSYPFGGKYHVPHGQATYTFLDTVLRKYAEIGPNGKIDDLKKVIADTVGDNTNNVFSAMAKILNYIHPIKKLKDFGVKEDELEVFAREVISTERLMKNNYVPLTLSDVVDMYRYCY